jgi:hypothetical protein
MKLKIKIKIYKKITRVNTSDPQNSRRRS